MVRHRRDLAAGVIVFHRAEGGCRFLLLRSRQTKRPLWEFPKGGVRPGESLETAALRELEEETGLQSADIRIIPGFACHEDYRFLADQGSDRMHVRKRVTYLLGEAAHTMVRISPAESSRFAWLSPDEARRKLRYSARRALLDQAVAAAACDAPA